MKRKQKYMHEMRERGKKDLLLDVFVVAGLIAIVFSVIQYINFKIDPVHAFLLGYKPIHVENDSMEPVLPVNSLALVRKVKYGAVGVHDIIAYSINGKDIVLRQVRSVNTAGIRTVAVKDGAYEGDLVLEEHVVGKLTFVWKGYALFAKRSTWVVLFLLMISLIAAAAAVYKRYKTKTQKISESVCDEAEQDFLDITPYTFAMLPQETQISQEEKTPQEEQTVYDFDTLLFEPQEAQIQPEYDFDSLLAEKVQSVEETVLPEPETVDKEPEDKQEENADAQAYYQGLIDLL